MVRLKVISLSITIFVIPKFQFLNGTIKSGSDGEQHNSSKKFQFLNGTIKSIDLNYTKQMEFGFQFLNGTIKSCHIRKSLYSFF